MKDLTAEIISSCTGSSLDKAEEYLPFMKEVLPAFQINTELRLAAFLAQVGHETGGLKSVKENLNYSAEGLANTWSNRYAQKLQNGAYARNKLGRYLPNPLAIKIARNPVKIANNCYANRMGNGDEQSGDGYRFIGKGLIQITGRENYTKLSKDTGIDFINKPELLEQPAYALISACWFWKVNNLNSLADKPDFITLTKRINGGTVGLAHRTELYNKALLLFKK